MQYGGAVLVVPTRTMRCRLGVPFVPASSTGSTLIFLAPENGAGTAGLTAPGHCRRRRCQCQCCCPGLLCPLRPPRSRINAAAYRCRRDGAPPLRRSSVQYRAGSIESLFKNGESLITLNLAPLLYCAATDRAVLLYSTPAVRCRGLQAPLPGCRRLRRSHPLYRSSIF